MSRSKQSHAFRKGLLAAAVIAAVAPLAWSGSRAPVVDRAQIVKPSQIATETYRQFIVTYRDSAAAKKSLQSRFATAATRTGMNIQGLRTLSTGADVIRVYQPLDRAESKKFMADLLKDPQILAVEPDVRMTALSVPNDPMYPQQWHYQNNAGGLNLEPAWDITKGSGVVVGVIDTGITPHSEFAGQLVPGYDFISNTDVSVDGDGRDADPNDPGDWSVAGECSVSDLSSSWHGTHVAGTIAALSDNGVGGAGVAPQAKVEPIRVLGKCGGSLSDIIDAITWGSGGDVPGVPANANPAEVLNMSLGGGGACGVALQSAIDGAVARGTTIVVAAGNSGGDAASQQPASCNNVITVSAVGPTGSLASYSSFGQVVDVAAPGGTGASPASANVLSTLNLGTTVQAGEGYGWYAGTSMASPHVAGVAALIQAASKTPKTPAQVQKILENTAYANGGFATGCSYDKPCGAGIVDATAAVRVASGADPLPADPPPPPPPPPATETLNGATIADIKVDAEGEVRYKIEVPNGAKYLLFGMFGGTGDADMYVRYDKAPTATSYDCRPYLFGNAENCFIAAPRAGTWYVTVKGYLPAAGISLYTSFIDANYPYKQAASVVQSENYRTQVTLTWEHGKKNVDIYRGGQIFATRRNVYKFTDSFRIMGSGSMTYKICNQGTNECSNDVSIQYSTKK